MFVYYVRNVGTCMGGAVQCKSTEMSNLHGNGRYIFGALSE